MEIIQAETAQHLQIIRDLFQEYFQWVHDGLGIDLGYQHVAAELAALPGYFAPPQGRLVLALEGAEPAGCVALRPMSDGACELKRMYVRPRFRGQGVGKALGQRMIDDARAIGYALIRLDTADSLTTARGLYTALGFRERSAYYEVPPDVLRWTIFMEMALTESPSRMTC